MTQADVVELLKTEPRPLTTQQIADKLGVSFATAKKNICGARHELTVYAERGRGGGKFRYALKGKR